MHLPSCNRWMPCNISVEEFKHNDLHKEKAHDGFDWNMSKCDYEQDNSKQQVQSTICECPFESPTLRDTNGQMG